MTIFYQLGESLYLNITNRCSCACTFCIRQGGDGVGDGENLWLEHEPTAQEVIADLERRQLSAYREVVFCGYGEPTESLDVLLEVCRYLKSAVPGVPVRLNTNGLSDLVNGQQTAPLLAGLADIVSVSLNAPDAPRYHEVVRSRFGQEAFDALLRFAADCREVVPHVQFTVVDILTSREIQACRELCAGMDIPLRVRVKQ